MAFKFVVLCSLLAVASAGLVGPITYAAAPSVSVLHKVANPAQDAVASTHENVVRSFGGTVSTHSKAVDTPYSSVRKTDTRISNNVYRPTVAKTVTYAAPAVAKTVTYTAPAPTATVYSHTSPVVYSHAAPAVYSHAAPAVAKTVTYAAPAVAKTVTYAAPAAQIYQHEAPAAQVYHHEAPVATTTYNHGPAATTYTHNAPGVAAYGSSQTVHYSPAEMVSHMSFDGFGTHWGF